MVVVHSFLALRTRTLIDGVTATSIIADCELEIFDKPAQPVRTITLACPRKDRIRLWPLPIVQPWYEVPVIPKEGINLE